MQFYWVNRLQWCFTGGMSLKKKSHFMPKKIFWLREFNKILEYVLRNDME